MVLSLRIYFFGTLSTSSAVKFHYVGGTADISTVKIPEPQQLASTGKALKKSSFLMKHPKNIKKSKKHPKLLNRNFYLDASEYSAGLQSECDGSGPKLFLQEMLRSMFQVVQSPLVSTCSDTFST